MWSKTTCFIFTNICHFLDPKAANDAEMEFLQKGKYCKSIESEQRDLNSEL